eukprot:4939078-Amphidinium_carterae.2
MSQATQVPLRFGVEICVRSQQNRLACNCRPSLCNHCNFLGVAIVSKPQSSTKALHTTEDKHFSMKDRNEFDILNNTKGPKRQNMLIVTMQTTRVTRHYLNNFQRQQQSTWNQGSRKMDSYVSNTYKNRWGETLPERDTKCLVSLSTLSFSLAADFSRSRADLMPH